MLGYGARYQAAHDMITTTGFCYARDLQQAALHNHCVGWLERRDTYQSLCCVVMGFAIALPILLALCFGYPSNPFPGTWLSSSRMPSGSSNKIE